MPQRKTRNKRLGRPARVVLLLHLNLNLVPKRLNLPPLPFSTTAQIANKKPFQSRNQRHGHDEENASDHRKIEKQLKHRVNPAKGPLKQWQRTSSVRRLSAEPLAKHTGDFIFPTEERSDRLAAPQKRQHLKGFWRR